MSSCHGWAGMDVTPLRSAEVWAQQLQIVLAGRDHRVSDAPAGGYRFHRGSMRKFINRRCALLIFGLACDSASRSLDVRRCVAGEDASDICLHATVFDAAISQQPLSS